MSRIILGTRGSDLALTQTRMVEALLKAAHPDLEVEIRIIKTTGDKRLDISLAQPGMLEKGLFTKELEEALARTEIHAAVHSLKDLPTELPEGFSIGAILKRADPSDLLIAKQPGGLAALRPGAVVATSSPRRQAQLLHLRPDLKTIEIRGNVPTRLRKLAEDPALDGLVLAQAGLDRLGRHIVPAGLEVSVLTEMIPAPGQGAIGIECRTDDGKTRARLEAIHHVPTARCVNAERDLLRSLGGGCSLPFGALATIVNGEVVLKTFPADKAALFKA